MAYNITTITETIRTLQGEATGQDGILQDLLEKAEEAHNRIEGAIILTQEIIDMRDGWMPDIQATLETLKDDVEDLILAYENY